MNRDDIVAGKTGGKWAECYALFGGVGAMVYPLVFYYVGFVSLDSRDEYLLCVGTTKKLMEAKDEDYSEWVRFTMLWNCNMMSVYLVLHYLLFSRPE